MKKIFLIIFMGLVFVMTGCSSGNLEKISIEKLNEKITNKETFIVYFASKESKLEKTLNNILEKYNITAYKVDINKISEDEKNNIQLNIAYEDPSIVFIINGTDPTKLSHVTDEDMRENLIIERLKDMKFIKEAS